MEEFLLLIDAFSIKTYGSKGKWCLTKSYRDIRRHNQLDGRPQVSLDIFSIEEALDPGSGRKKKAVQTKLTIKWGA